MEINNTNFKISFQKIDKDFAVKLISLLEERLKRIYKTFGFKSAIKCSITVCSKVEEYIVCTGKMTEDYQSWMVGYSDSAKKLICLLSPISAVDFTELDILKIAVHELVHIIFDNELGVLENEAWISEGIAILLAEQTNLSYMDENNFPKISCISGICSGGETPVNFSDNGGYDYAGIYVWYFIEKFGTDKFLSAYKNESNANELIYNGFEREAIKKFNAL